MEKYICPTCKKEFKKHVYKKSQAVYCSQKCAYMGRSLGYSKRIIKKPYNCRRKSPKICLVCQKEYIYRTKTQKYCSRGCFEIAHKQYMSGEKNPAYKNGESYNKRSYRGDDWETLRKEIYTRDGYICQDCGVRCLGKRDYRQNSDRIIQCHHIENYKETHNNEKGNLITLCLKCHMKRHNKKEIGVG